MKSLAGGSLGALVFGIVTGFTCSAQTSAPTPNSTASEAARLQELSKKIDEQNAKIDMLSQQILKLQLEFSHQRPGVMIGEGAASSSSPTTTTSATSTSATTPDPSGKTGNGSSHVVARGETLTSIAKMYSVSVTDLQKFNHIDNPLKLLAGQTLQIPPSPIPSPASSPE